MVVFHLSINSAWFQSYLSLLALFSKVSAAFRFHKHQNVVFQPWAPAYNYACPLQCYSEQENCLGLLCFGKVKVWLQLDYFLFVKHNAMLFC